MTKKSFVLEVTSYFILFVHTGHTEVILIWRDMNEAMLIFVSPSFQYCLRAEAVMAARFSLIIEGITETLEWFQKECN